MFRDIEDEEKRFFPSLRAIYDKPGGFPEAVEEIAGLLGREDSLQAILSEYEAFAAAYQDNPDILRFRFYRPLVLQAQLQIYSGNLCTLPPLKVMTLSGVCISPWMRLTDFCAEENAAPTTGWQCIPLPQPHRPQGARGFLKELPWGIQRVSWRK